MARLKCQKTLVVSGIVLTCVDYVHHVKFFGRSIGENAKSTSVAGYIRNSKRLISFDNYFP